MRLSSFDFFHFQATESPANMAHEACFGKRRLWPLERCLLPRSPRHHLPNELDQRPAGYAQKAGRIVSNLYTQATMGP
jgi:hypothetical protein